MLKGQMYNSPRTELKVTLNRRSTVYPRRDKVCQKWENDEIFYKLVQNRILGVFKHKFKVFEAVPSFFFNLKKLQKCCNAKKI